MLSINIKNSLSRRMITCFIMFQTISILVINLPGSKKKLGTTNCSAKIGKTGNLKILCENEGTRSINSNKFENVTENLKMQDIYNFIEFGQNIVKMKNTIRNNDKKSYLNWDCLKNKQEIVFHILGSPSSMNRILNKTDLLSNGKYKDNEFLHEINIEVINKYKDLKKGSSTDKAFDLVHVNTDNFSFLKTNEI